MPSFDQPISFFARILFERLHGQHWQILFAFCFCFCFRAKATEILLFFCPQDLCWSGFLFKLSEGCLHQDQAEAMRNNLPGTGPVPSREGATCLMPGQGTPSETQSTDLQTSIKHQTCWTMAEARLCAFRVPSANFLLDRIMKQWKAVA